MASAEKKTSHKGELAQMTSLHNTPWLHRSKAQTGSHRYGNTRTHTHKCTQRGLNSKQLQTQKVQQNNAGPVLWVSFTRQQARPVSLGYVHRCVRFCVRHPPFLSHYSFSLPDMLWWRDKLKVILREQRFRTGMCGMTLSCSVDKKHIRGWYGVIWACVITVLNMSLGLMAWFGRAWRVICTVST